MAHHAGAHKTARKTTAARHSADHEADFKRESEEHDEKTKLTTVGLLFSSDSQSHFDDNEFGSPMPSHIIHKNGIGEQPKTLMVPANNLTPGKGKPDEKAKKAKKVSKDDKAKADKHHKDLITMEEIEATLERKHYAEDDIDLEQLRAKVKHNRLTYELNALKKSENLFNILMNT